MKACGKSARTASPEEKTGAAPSVAKLGIDPAGGEESSALSAGAVYFAAAKS